MSHVGRLATTDRCATSEVYDPHEPRNIASATSSAEMRCPAASEARTLATTFGRTAGDSLDMLSTYLGVPWRVLDDGTCSLASPTLAPFSPALDAILTGEAPSSARVIIAADTLTARPGMTWKGRTIVGVLHVVSEGGLRSTLDLT